MMILTPIVFRSKSKLYKHQKSKKFVVNLQLQTIQIFTIDFQLLILCLSYFFTLHLLHKACARGTSMEVPLACACFILSRVTKSQMTKTDVY